MNEHDKPLVYFLIYLCVFMVFVLLVNSFGNLLLPCDWRTGFLCEDSTQLEEPS